MKIVSGKFQLIIDGEINEHTECFMKTMLAILEKGKDNPSVQLNVLVAIFTGKTLVELTSGDESPKAQIIANMIRYIPKSVSSQMDNDIREKLGGNFDDFMRGKIK